MSDLIRSDFCEQRRLRVNKTLDVGSPAGDHPLVGATSLGCRVPVTHRSEISGPILSRVNQQNGNVVSSLLSSADETNLANPQPSMWLSGAPSGVLAGPATLSYPAAAPSIVNTLFLNGAPSVVPASGAKGFGQGSGIIKTILLPNGMEVLADNYLADHSMRTYLRIPTTGDATTPLGLNYSTPTGTEIFLGAPDPFYRWLFQYSTVLPMTPVGDTIFSKIVGSQTWLVFVELFFWAVNPSRVGHESLVISGSSGPVTGVALSAAGGANNNGPLQDRKRSYFPLDTFTCPSYGGVHSSTLTLNGLRSKLLFYTQELQNYSLATVNGQGLSPIAGSVPTPQWSPEIIPLFPPPDITVVNELESTGEVFTGGFNPHSVQFFGPLNQVSLIDINPADTTLTVILQGGTVFGEDFSTSPPITKTITLPKNPGENLWVEGAAIWTLRKIGPP